MTRVKLLPRINALGVSAILDRADGSVPTPENADDVIQAHSSFVWFAPSGGTASVELAGDISRELREIAKSCGYPSEVGSKDRATFDCEAAIWLGTHDDLRTGEALRDDVWGFLTAALLPQLVAWRFPDLSPKRFSGGVRNAFQRLWMRGSTLDRGEDHPDRWGLVRALSEDAMVQIFERASISSDARLARAVAEAWVVTADTIGTGRMEDIMRRAIKYLRIRNEIIDLGYLEDDALRLTCRTAFERIAGINSA